MKKFLQATGFVLFLALAALALFTACKSGINQCKKYAKGDTQKFRDCANF